MQLADFDWNALATNVIKAGAAYQQTRDANKLQMAQLQAQLKAQAMVGAQPPVAYPPQATPVLVARPQIATSQIQAGVGTRFVERPAFPAWAVPAAIGGAAFVLLLALRR